MTVDFLMQTIVAGIMASYVLLTLAMWGYRIGLPRLDFASAMVSLTYGPSFEGKEQPYWAGMLVVYFNGVFFTLLYATFVSQYLPGIPLMKGAIWGVTLWFISGIFFIPVFSREGFFLSHIHPMAWLANLIAHGGFGLVVGWLAPISN